MPDGDARPPAPAQADSGPLLDRAVAALPAGEPRPGQAAMCDAVARAFIERRHLLVQAGTGTGKSVAYLVPAVAQGSTVVVATATKALQEQLVGKDLPFLAEHLGIPFSYALLKGRGNYVCQAQLATVEGDRQQALDGLRRGDDDTLDEIVEWAATTTSGDRADLPVAVSDALWDRVSLDSRECPGRTRCDFGESCFAERARDTARAADVVVVNAALYSQHLASGGFVLPEHDFLVVDEAHMLEDVCADAFAVTIGAARLARLDGLVRALFTSDLPAGHPAVRLGEWPNRIDVLLAGAPLDEQIQLDDAGLREPLVALEQVLAEVGGTLSGLESSDDDARRRASRAARFVAATRADVQGLLAARPETHAVWVEGRTSRWVAAAPTDVGPALAETLFARTTTVLTSATLALAGDFSQLAWRLGLRDELAEAGRPAPATAEGTGEDAVGQPGEDTGEAPRPGHAPADPVAFDALDVGSPFEYRKQAILYVAAHLPDPRHDTFEAAALDEAVALVRAAGGRTLGLCTSLRAATALRDRLRDELDVPVLSPDEIPRARLMEEFAAEETSCLIGSIGLWQGLDVPGPGVTLVLIDKIPFARPNDPLALARRRRAEAEGKDAFATFDLPRAAMLLAQGAGRLVRSSTDRGVVAVLDRRLATSGYGRRLMASLPPMYPMTDGERVRAALMRLTGAAS